MSEFRFLIAKLEGSTPEQWLHVWADAYTDDDDTEHDDLVGRSNILSAEDFEQIGKWKDNAKSGGRWAENVASVAYLVWKRAAKETPKCPEESGVEGFLNRWSGETYTDVFANKSVVKHFGLSRATTLLHFVSGGHYPIFDSRVRTSFARIGGNPAGETARWYLDVFCPFFWKLATMCKTENDLRRLDKALFSYGAFDGLPFPN